MWSSEALDKLQVKTIPEVGIEQQSTSLVV